MSNVRYIYLRDDVNMRNYDNGVVCFGYMFTDTGSIIASACFCSKNDRFNKKLAHKIIGGRIEKGQCVVIIDNLDKEPKYEECIELVLKSFPKKEWHEVLNIPEWAKAVPRRRK